MWRHLSCRRASIFCQPKASIALWVRLFGKARRPIWLLPSARRRAGQSAGYREELLFRPEKSGRDAGWTRWRSRTGWSWIALSGRRQLVLSPGIEVAGVMALEQLAGRFAPCTVDLA